MKGIVLCFHGPTFLLYRDVAFIVYQQHLECFC